MHTGTIPEDYSGSQYCQSRCSFQERRQLPWIMKCHGSCDWQVWQGLWKWRRYIVWQFPENIRIGHAKRVSCFKLSDSLVCYKLIVHNNSNFSPLPSSNFWKILEKSYSVTAGIDIQGQSFWTWIRWQYCWNKSTWRCLCPSQFDEKTFLCSKLESGPLVGGHIQQNDSAGIFLEKSYWPQSFALFELNFELMGERENFNIILLSFRSSFSRFL